MRLAASGYTIALPAWVDGALSEVPDAVPDRTERMRLVNALADRNWREGNGGPFAALVAETATGRIVSVGVNVVLASGVSSSHAEVTALGVAQRAIGGWDLGAEGQPEHELVVNWRPCVQCYGAAMWSGVRTLVVAGSGPELERITTFDEGPMREDWAEQFEQRGIRVVDGMLRDEALEVFRAYREAVDAGGITVYNARRRWGVARRRRGTSMTALPVHRDRIALNAIQWINVKADPDDPASEDLWRYADPDFRADYPGVLAQIREAGFGAVMMEVLATQTLQDYARMIAESGLALGPGYASMPIPEDHGVTLAPGSAERVHWFDGIRRKAEESNFFGLSTVFLAPEVGWTESFVRTREAVGVGAGFSQARLDAQIEFLGEAAEVLQAEGIRAGLHNHVGTWVETEDEIEQTLAAIPAELLGASFDLGHLAWAGIDPATMLRRHADRLVDLHIKDLDLGIAAASRAVPTPYQLASDRGLFLEPGLGHLDLVGALSALPADFDGWIIVEVDKASMDPFASAQASWGWVEATLPA